MTGEGSLSALSQEGLWRVTALIRRQTAVAESRIDEALVPAIADALRAEARLVRLIVDRPPVALDPVVAGMFPPLFDALIEFWFESASDASAVMAQSGTTKPFVLPQTALSIVNEA